MVFAEGVFFLQGLMFFKARMNRKKVAFEHHWHSCLSDEDEALILMSFGICFVTSDCNVHGVISWVTRQLCTSLAGKNEGGKVSKCKEQSRDVVYDI